MTPQEAIELVKQCGLNIEGVKHTECEKVVLTALEKQIPKKPNKIKWDYTCPCCNADEFYLIYDCQKDGKYNYCAKCGQALDWSDTE